MPSQLHKMLVVLIRNRPAPTATLAQESLGVSLPPYAEARVEDAGLTDVQPTAYRADLVVLLYDDSKPAFGIVLEAQLSLDQQKPFSWPVYAVTLRARAECPSQRLYRRLTSTWRAGQPSRSSSAPATASRPG